ncbi:YajQ family cyclic di-GMP-binding protein [bacterium]|nr:YajQ family cyclic di-GMP-binding protein [bacterium]
MPSFDVVSEVNLQEVDNAVNQAKKELEGRYDFRGSKSSIDLEKSEISIFAEDQMKMKALQDIFNQKLAKRGVSLKALDLGQVEQATGGAQRIKIKLKQGLEGDDAKKVAKLIKEADLKKVQASIMGDHVRISGPKKDDLQAAMQLLRDKSDRELQFKNFKD